jgi:drug/metabolite transporter (DMT)-like permease
MILSSVLFSVMSLLVRLAAADSFLTSFVRFGVGVAVVGSLAFARRTRLEFVNIPLLLLRGVTGSIAVTRRLAIELGLARSVLLHTYPLFAAVGGAVFLKERVRPLGWAALAAAVGGMVLMRWGGIVAGGSADPMAAFWFAIVLVGAVVAGLAIVAVRRLTATDSAYAIFFSQSLVGFWVTFVPALARPAAFTPRLALLLLALGLVAAGAQLLMTWSYGRVDIATGSLLGMFAPVISVVVGVLAFRESLGAVEAVGAAIVLAACVAVMVPGRRTAVERRS